MILVSDRFVGFEKGKIMTTYIQKLFGIVAALAIVQSATSLPANARQGEYQRIGNVSEFRDSLVDKPLMLNGEALVLGADGTFNGVYRGRNYQGNWNWNAEYDTICLFSKAPIERFNCSIVEINTKSQQVNFRRHPVQRVASDFLNYMPIFSSKFSYVENMD